MNGAEIRWLHSFTSAGIADADSRFQERILLLTDKQIYRINFDFSYKTVSSTKAIPLVRITNISRLLPCALLL
jgi:hypothetical protein